MKIMKQVRCVNESVSARILLAALLVSLAAGTAWGRESLKSMKDQYTAIGDELNGITPQEQQPQSSDDDGTISLLGVKSARMSGSMGLGPQDPRYIEYLKVREEGGKIGDSLYQARQAESIAADKVRDINEILDNNPKKIKYLHDEIQSHPDDTTKKQALSDKINKLQAEIDKANYQLDPATKNLQKAQAVTQEWTQKDQANSAQLTRMDIDAEKSMKKKP